MASKFPMRKEAMKAKIEGLMPHPPLTRKTVKLILKDVGAAFPA